MNVLKRNIGTTWLNMQYNGFLLFYSILLILCFAIAINRTFSGIVF
jgi:hypothetical protein